jgi:Flp pilus assembly protein TadG
MKKYSKNFLGNDRGMAAIEMAFVMPFMLLLYFGLVDATALISFNRKITSAAGTTADLVAQEKTDVLRTKILDEFNATAMIMAPTDIAGVKVEVFNFRNTGTAAAPNIVKQWQIDNGNGPSCGTAPATTGMADLMTAGNDVVVARACMTYTPYVATFMGTTILGATTFTLNQSVSVRPRSSLQLACWQTTKAAAVLCS